MANNLLMPCLSYFRHKLFEFQAFHNQAHIINSTGIIIYFCGTYYLYTLPPPSPPHPLNDSRQLEWDSGVGCGCRWRWGAGWVVEGRLGSNSMKVLVYLPTRLLPLPKNITFAWKTQYECNLIVLSSSARYSIIFLE